MVVHNTIQWRRKLFSSRGADLVRNFIGAGSGPAGPAMDIHKCIYTAYQVKSRELTGQRSTYIVRTSPKYDSSGFVTSCRSLTEIVGGLSPLLLKLRGALAPPAPPFPTPLLYRMELVCMAAAPFQPPPGWSLCCCTVLLRRVDTRRRLHLLSTSTSYSEWFKSLQK